MFESTRKKQSDLWIQFAAPFLSNLKTLMLHSMHQCCHHWHWLWRQWRKIIGALHHHCQSCCVNDKKNKTTSVVKDDIRSCSSNSWSPWWTVVATADPLFCWNNIFVSNDDQVELTFSKKQRFDKGPSAQCLKISQKSHVSTLIAEYCSFLRSCSLRSQMM